MSRHVLFLLASARPGGNAEQLARRAASGLSGAEVQTWLRLDDHPLPPFRDRRHADGYGPLEGNPRWLAETTIAATDLVFVTPVYWYSLPASAKAYLDHWSWWMRDPTLGFRARLAGRRMWAIVVDSSEPSDRAWEPLVGTLERTARYLEMRWMGALHGHGNRPGDVLTDPATTLAADRYLRI